MYKILSQLNKDIEKTFKYLENNRERDQKRDEARQETFNCELLYRAMHR